MSYLPPTSIVTAKLEDEQALADVIAALWGAGWTVISVLGDPSVASDYRVAALRGSLTSLDLAELEVALPCVIEYSSTQPEPEEPPT